MEDAPVVAEQQETMEPAPSLQDKLTALGESHELIDIKLRDGQWWLRAVKEVKPRNTSGEPTRKVEVTGATLEECVDKVMG